MAKLENKEPETRNRQPDTREQTYRNQPNLIHKKTYEIPFIFVTYVLDILLLN